MNRKRTQTSFLENQVIYQTTTIWNTCNVTAGSAVGGLIGHAIANKGVKNKGLSKDTDLTKFNILLSIYVINVSFLHF